MSLFVMESLALDVLCPDAPRQSQFISGSAKSMQNVYTQQAVVRVWRNLKVLGKMPTSHFGHASVTVTGTTVPEKKQHISFWPKSSIDNHIGAFRTQGGSATNYASSDRQNEMNTLTAIRLEVGYCKSQVPPIPYPREWDEILLAMHKSPLSNPRPGQKRLVDEYGNVLTDNEDGVTVPLYSQSPQAKFFLPGLMADGRFWGLNLTRIGNWWKEFMKVSPPYQAFGRNNCAGVALRALQEGGSDAIVKCPNVRVYAEPAQVEEYAKELSIQLERLDTWAKTLESDIKQTIISGQVRVRDVPGVDVKDGLWTVDAWMKESALGVLYRRGDTLREIDESLTRFHQFTWKDAFVERYEAFVQLFLNIVKHRQDKAESKRSDAVVRLAGQILTILQNRRFYAH